MHRPVESGVAVYAEWGVSSFSELAPLANDRSDTYSTTLTSGPASRFDIIRTYYDEPYPLFGEGEMHMSEEYDQLFLAGAVSWSESIPDNTQATYDQEVSRMVYSYDERGRVIWMGQYIPGLGVKMLKYLYGPIDEVLQVAYQPEESDAFYHYYEYNKDSQLESVYATDQDIMDPRYLKITVEDKDQYLQARYDYYKHGPLKTMYLGGKNADGQHLQKLDYVYTITGALKSLNDINDADENGAMRDAFAMQLQYFSGDYINAADELAGRFTSYDAGAEEFSNVKAALWSHLPDGADPEFSAPDAFVYDYDPASQLTGAMYASLSGNALVDASSYQVENLVYDLNGNIQSLHRKGQDGNTLSPTVDGTTLTHNFNYNYNPLKRNQLTSVDMQGGGNYQTNAYNSIGQLISQQQMGVNYGMEYDATGPANVYNNSGYFNDNGLVPDEVEPKNNLDNLLVFEEVVPDASGNIEIGMYQFAYNGYLTAIMLEEYAFNESNPSIEVPVIEINE
ncbi:unnamed protein product, partial [Symbiodinium microadriaticum]